MGLNKRTALLSAAILTFGLGTLYLGLTMKSPRESLQPNHWDILIYTQTWANTLCYSWKHQNPSHSCYFPSNQSLWAVHGLWPTKYGTIGPQFCNKTLVFDPTAIQGIKDKLDKYWPDIELGFNDPANMSSSNISLSNKKQSIWFHEWEKHGTCAVTLPALNSELKYFSQGIEWSEKYNMKNVLEKAGIKVNSTTLYVADYWKAVKSVLKTNAWVQCLMKHDTKEQLLDEIRICFDKKLNLIDCNGIMSKPYRGSSKSHSLTNCDPKRPISYLDYVPTLNTSTANEPNHWDVLIFTQTWANTLCYSWKHQNASHSCHFPSNQSLWAVHGIWPTKYGTIGPQFCNKSLVFDPSAIYGLQDKLDNYWPDIEIGFNDSTNTNSSNMSMSNKKQSIWFHEWEKHGTCAVTLPTLNSEFKYFYQGIEWSEQYNMKNVLEKGGIMINSTTLYVDDYWKAVKSVLKTNAWVQCLMKHDTKEQLLDEIRICFDKKLNLIDCDGIMSEYHQDSSKSHSLTNCDPKQPILYLDYVPTFNTSTVDEHSKVLFRAKRKVVDHSNEWVTKSPRHFNRSNSYQPRTNTTFVNNLNRSNSYPYIQRKEWDVLTFSQAWPYTFCHTWTVDSNTHTCNLPANRNQWTVHGIWPTKIGTFGPFYCNNQTSFSINTLSTIVPELRNRWTDIKGSKRWANKKEGELWKHEWLKHGTCSKTLPNLDSELKYFKQGLDWSKQYPLSDLLSKGGIKPNGTYPVNQIWHTLRTALGKNPRIDCFMDKNSPKAYIDEVRLCFNKTLSLVDCDFFRRNSNKPFTNCPLNEDIYYLGAVV